VTRSPKTNVRLLATGRLISITGGAAAYTALMFTVWDRTHSATWQSAALLLTFGVVGLLSPLTGHLGDRVDRRLVLVVSEAVAALFYLGMAFAHDPVWLIGLAFGSAVAEAPFVSASAATIPNLVERDEDISWANSLLGIGRNGGIMLGPVIGGVLLGVIGPSWVFGLNALSFGVSIVLTLLIRGRFQQDRTDESDAGGVLAGLSLLAGDPVLARMSLAWFVFLLGAGMTMVADAPLVEEFGAGSTGFGFLITAWGGGSVIGSLLGRRLSERTEYRWLVLGSFGVALSCATVAVSPWFALVLGSVLVMGIADGLSIVAETSLLQRRSPDAVRSRVVAGFEGILSLGIAIAYVGAGPVLAVLGPKPVYAVGAVGGLLATLILLPLLRGERPGAEIPPAVEPQIGERPHPDRARTV
jgi:MFS family permease